MSTHDDLTSDAHAMIKKHAKIRKLEADVKQLQQNLSDAFDNYQKSDYDGHLWEVFTVCRKQFLDKRLEYINLVGEI